MRETRAQVSAFLSRLDVVEERLRQHAAGPAASGLTQPDPRSGEQWEAGQVWAHLAEFPAYWIDQARAVATLWREAPVPFGRTKADPDRLAAIARDRGRSSAALWGRIDEGIQATRRFLQDTPDGAWLACGRHPTLGVMTLADLMDEFLIGHFEEHARQLDELPLKSQG